MSKIGETMRGDHYRITQADIDNAELHKAIKVTQYKYFGDYEFSSEQAEAVETLVEFALTARSDGWRDIETWPGTDEAHALVCKAGQMFPVVACYDANNNDWVSFNGYYERTNGRLVPTHWQPAPTPPEATP